MPSIHGSMNVDKIKKKLLRTMLKQSLKNRKGQLFHLVLGELESPINKGVGFTLTEIRKHMPFLDKDPELHNHNVKKLLQ